MQIDELMQLMRARRSIRRYQADRPVEPEKIDTLLRAAMCAPSACNLQPWEFIVVQGEARMAALRAAIRIGDYNAPLAVVVLANQANIPWSGNGYQIDCAAAIENMLLAAAGLGLGSCFLMGPMAAFSDPALRARLELPEGYEPLVGVALGYAAPEHPAAPERTDAGITWCR